MVKKFVTHTDKRNIEVDLIVISTEELKITLKKFRTEVNLRKKTNMSTPSALTGIKSVILRRRFLTTEASTFRKISNLWQPIKCLLSNVNFIVK